MGVEFKDASDFAWWAGTDLKRWRHSIGNRILHSEYGEGVIIDIQPAKFVANNVKVIVSFPSIDMPEVTLLSMSFKVGNTVQVYPPPAIERRLKPQHLANRTNPESINCNGSRSGIATPNPVTRRQSVRTHVIENLLKLIASRLDDYRTWEMSQVTPDHVDRWVQQFDQSDRETILFEMNRFVQHFYLSRSWTKNILEKLILGIFSSRDDVKKTKFLNIQRTGKSQKDLLEIVDEILQSRFHVSVDECGAIHPRSFIYIDDAIYTGNRLRYDLTADGSNTGHTTPAWISRHAPENSQLLLFFLASHSAGEDYAMRYVHAAARQKKVRVIGPSAAVRLKNLRYPNVNELHCIWPDSSHGIPIVDKYAVNVRDTLWPGDSLYRPLGVPRQETFFSSSEAREVVERAFLHRGTELIQSTDIESMRPLGFEKRPSLGFGTMLATYRNVANNAPLVLWWSANGWHPLLRRVVADTFQDSRSYQLVEQFTDDDLDDVPF